MSVYKLMAAAGCLLAANQIGRAGGQELNAHAQGAGVESEIRALSAEVRAEIRALSASQLRDELQQMVRRAANQADNASRVSGSPQLQLKLLREASATLVWVRTHM